MQRQSLERKLKLCKYDVCIPKCRFSEFKEAPACHTSNPLYCRLFKKYVERYAHSIGYQLTHKS